MKKRPNPFTWLLILALAFTLAEDGLAGGKKDKKKKKKQATQSETTDKKEAPSPAASAPPVVKDVDKRLLAYDTAGARSLLAGQQLDSNPHLQVADGRVLTQEGNHGQATARLDAAAAALSDDPAPLVYLGEAHLRAYDVAKAEDAFRRAEQRARKLLDGSPDNVDALYFLGVSQKVLGKHAEALSTLNKARAASPGDVGIVLQIGATQTLQKDWPAAFATLTQVIEMNRRIAYAYYYRGLAADKIGRKDVLVEDFHNFLDLAPNAPEADQVREFLSAL